jgi:hypothetical protein
MLSQFQIFTILPKILFIGFHQSIENVEKIQKSLFQEKIRSVGYLFLDSLLYTTHGQMGKALILFT